MKARAIGVLTVVLIAWLCAARPATAGDVDLTALTQETQKISQKLNELTLVWWIPEEFWKASLAQQKQLSAKQIDDFLKTMRQYVMIIVVKGKIDVNSAFESEEYVRTNTKVIDRQGNACTPLNDADIDATAKLVLATIKPILSNSLGPMGKSMHILVFSAKTADGRQIVNTKRKGRFKVAVANEEFKWRLPFDSVLPKQACPKCKEDCKGSWIFCPWCGTKLAK